MNARLLILVVVGLALTALSLASCETYPAVAPTPSPPLGPRLVEAAEALHAEAATMEAQATRQAQGTRDALDAAARATADALAAAGTAQALTMEATRAAWALDATATAVAAQSAATAQAATAQAQASSATATAQAAALWVEQTAQAVAAFNVEATRQAVERQAQRERSTQVFQTYGPWALLALSIALLLIVGYHALPVLLARLRVIRRKADEGEPVVVMEREGMGGIEKIALPLRAFWHLIDTGETPALPAPEFQDRAAARQQLANVMLAVRGGRRRVVRRLPAPQPVQVGQAVDGVIQVVEPDRVRPWLDDVETQLLEEVNQ